MSLLGLLSPGVQALIITGLFALLVVIACNRRAAINLVAFLQDLRDLTHSSGRPGSRRKRNREFSRSGNRSRVSDKYELGVHQGVQAHEQQPNA
jgi:hypothetical protein